MHNPIETQIYVVHPLWATYTREIVMSFLFIIQQMKGYNLQHTRCNFLFFLSQYILSEYNIFSHPQPQYNSLIYRRGFPSRGKITNITSTIKFATL
jgi:hypothetical protein